MGRGARAGGCGLKCRTAHSQATLEGIGLLLNHAYCATPEMHEVIKSEISELANTKVDALAWKLHKERAFKLTLKTDLFQQQHNVEQYLVRTHVHG
jgi:hypothetical protein